jgi:hypothetical protein
MPDKVNYTEPFRDIVQGRLNATFRLDADQEPLYDTYDDEPRLRHYAIDLQLISPNSAAIDQVTYYMEDSSFEYDPEGQTGDRDNQFPMEINSYGDVEVLVTVSIGGRKIKQRAWLSNMLENGHSEDMRPTIREALRRIKAN